MPVDHPSLLVTHALIHFTAEQTSLGLMPTFILTKWCSAQFGML